MIRKLVLNDGRSESELVLKGTIVVGRDPSCHINDLDPLLSRRHAEFVASSEGVIVRDLGSRNGILVNGNKVPRQVLTPGDIVQLVHLELRYVEDVSPQAIEHNVQAHAMTATGIETPTMAPLPRPAAPAAPPPAAAAAHTDADATSAVRMPDLSDFDRTMAPARPPERPAAAAVTDLDATLAPTSWPVGARALAAPPAVSDESIDETRLPRAPVRPTAPESHPGRRLRGPLVADRSLIVTDASGSCLALLGSA
jgi:predicted component of type VI protein secretion system